MFSERIVGISIVSVDVDHRHLKRTLSPYFRNLPLLHITIRLHLIWRLLKFMQWLARKQYLLRRRTRQIRLNAVGRVKVGDNIIDL